MQPSSAAQLEFFAPLPPQRAKRRMQWIPLQKLQLSITQIISIFADFATLLTCMHSFHRSPSMSQSAGRLCFFYSEEQEQRGYKLVTSQSWRSEIAQLKQEMAQISLSNEEPDYRNYDYEQWGEWVDTLTQEWEEKINLESDLGEFRKQLLSFHIYPLCYFPVRLPHSLFSAKLRRGNFHSGLYCYTLFQAKNRTFWRKLTNKEAEDYRLKQMSNFLQHLQHKNIIIAYKELLFGSYAGVTSGDINVFSFNYQLPLPSQFPTSTQLLPFSIQKTALTARTQIQFQLRYEIYKINKRNVTMVLRSTPHWLLDTCGFFSFYKKWEEFQYQWAQTPEGQLFEPLSFKIIRVGQGLTMTTVIQIFKQERNESWLQMLVKTVDRHLLLWLIFEERLERQCRMFGKVGYDRQERGVERQLKLALEWADYLSNQIGELSKGEQTHIEEQ